MPGRLSSAPIDSAESTSLLRIYASAASAAVGRERAVRRAGDYDEAEISTSTRRHYAGRSDAEKRHQRRSRKTRVRCRRADPDKVPGWSFGPEVEGSQINRGRLSSLPTCRSPPATLNGLEINP